MESKKCLLIDHALDNFTLLALPTENIREIISGPVPKESFIIYENKPVPIYSKMYYKDPNETCYSIILEYAFSYIVLVTKKVHGIKNATHLKTFSNNYFSGTAQFEDLMDIPIVNVKNLFKSQKFESRFEKKEVFHKSLVIVVPQNSSFDKIEVTLSDLYIPYKLCGGILELESWLHEKFSYGKGTGLSVNDLVDSIIVPSSLASNYEWKKNVSLNPKFNSLPVLFLEENSDPVQQITQYIQSRIRKQSFQHFPNLS